MREKLRLPQELIRIVFEEAAFDSTAAAATLCRVSRASRAWTLPVLYGTVVLSTPSVIASVALQTCSDVAVDGLAPKSHVRRLWLGPIREAPPLSLGTARGTCNLSRDTCWPIPHVHRLLSHLTSLRSLALINTTRDVWESLLPIIPASVESLWLGPVHGKVSWDYLPCRHNLVEFVSIDTFLYPLELVQVVSATRVRRVCRYFRSGDAAALALKLPRGLDTSEVRAKIEVVCLSEGSEHTSEIRDTIGVDSTIRMWTKPGEVDFLAAIFRDWRDADP